MRLPSRTSILLSEQFPRTVEYSCMACWQLFPGLGASCGFFEAFLAYIGRWNLERGSLVFHHIVITITANRKSRDNAAQEVRRSCRRLVGSEPERLRTGPSTAKRQQVATSKSLRLRLPRAKRLRPSVDHAFKACLVQCWGRSLASKLKIYHL